MGASSHGRKAPRRSEVAALLLRVMEAGSSDSFFKYIEPDNVVRNIREGGRMQHTSVNGIRVAFDLRGTGEPVVMIHGAQGDQTMFNDMAASFARHYRVLTFDQRGSGLSEKPEMDYTIGLLADDTAALMDHLGIPAAHIIGVSMGGTIAQEFALRHPTKVISLVLGCTTAGGPKAVRIGGSAFSAAYAAEPMSAA